MDGILTNVVGRHASENTKYYALYSFYCLYLSQAKIAQIFCKSATTISAWIEQYQQTGTVSQKKRQKYPSFTDEEIHWFGEFYQKNPLSFLDESQLAFRKRFAWSVSMLSVWRIIHYQLGLTRK
ncbi:hypothetical protein HK096_006949, partial [Nowakowskiella sp. JEL0078]